MKIALSKRAENLLRTLNSLDEKELIEWGENLFRKMDELTHREVSLILNDYEELEENGFIIMVMGETKIKKYIAPEKILLKKRYERKCLRNLPESS